jgi:hypothetical protein
MTLVDQCVKRQLADDWQTKPTARTEAGIGVPEIVSAA